MNRYKTVIGEATAEQVIEKSKFIAHVKPVCDKEEADSFIAAIREKHREATHNVPAMVIGDKFQLQWASDDGEPRGTAGAPIARMLVKEGITNVVVVVTRYFGGVKLGTGGLVRAYTNSAKIGVFAAGVCWVKDVCFLVIKTEYTHLNKIQNIAENEKFEIKEALYEDKVTLKLAAEPEDVDKIKIVLAGVSAGGFRLISETVEMIKNFH